MKLVHRKTEEMWWAVDKDGWPVVFARTPKEARRKYRQWYIYLTVADEVQAQKYLRGEIQVK